MVISDIQLEWLLNELKNLPGWKVRKVYRKTLGDNGSTITYINPPKIGKNRYRASISFSKRDGNNSMYSPFGRKPYSCLSFSNEKIFNDFISIVKEISKVREGYEEKASVKTLVKFDFPEKMEVAKDFYLTRGKIEIFDFLSQEMRFVNKKVKSKMEDLVKDLVEFAMEGGK